MRNNGTTAAVISALSTSPLASQMRQTAMLTSASFAYTIKMFPHPVLGFGGLGKPGLVHYTVANSIFVAGARARRGRRNDHLIDAGSTTTVVI